MIPPHRIHRLAPCRNPIHFAEQIRIDGKPRIRRQFLYGSDKILPLALPVKPHCPAAAYEFFAKCLPCSIHPRYAFPL